MLSPKHTEIDSQFFEFRKMKSFLDIGVYTHVDGVPHPPIDVAQRYVHSQLLIDLISVFDNAVMYFFDHLKMKHSRGKSEFEILKDAGQIVSPQHFKWYKELRNISAHKFIRHDWHFLDQATEHITNQLEVWKILSATLNFRRFYQLNDDGVHYVGARIDDYVILAYKTGENRVPVGTSSYAGKHIDMSFGEFITIKQSWSRRIIYSRAS
jgi:hypothetical protein